MTRLHPRLLVPSDRLNASDSEDRSLFTKEGWMKFMVTEKMGRLMVAAQLLTPEQIYFSVPMPTMDVPKAEVMEPRNRHERRRQAARQRMD